MLVINQIKFVPQRQNTNFKRIQRVCAVSRASGVVKENLVGTQPQDLKNPIHAWASGIKQARVQDFGGGTGLTAYMRLPPEQYDLLDPSIISYYGGNKFRLRVPRIDFLGLWVEPRIDMEVDVTDERVLAQAFNCAVDGPPAIKAINSQFCFKLSLKITHVPAWELQSRQYNSNNKQFGYGEMIGDIRLDVWCENIPPLAIVPAEIVQASVNLALDQGVNTMLAFFLDRLARDSEAWQKSPTYRQARREKAQSFLS